MGSKLLTMERIVLRPVSFMLVALALWVPGGCSVSAQIQSNNLETTGDFYGVQAIPTPGLWMGRVDRIVDHSPLGQLRSQAVKRKHDDESQFDLLFNMG